MANESDISCDYDKDFPMISRKGERSAFKIRKGPNTWRVDKLRLGRLNDISLLPIPQHSKDILSKLTIKRQLNEIKEVLKVANDCVTLKAKFDMDKEIFGHIDTQDVVIKIFTGKNHTKPDVDSAKQYNVSATIERKNVDHGYKQYFYQRTPVLCIDNVVISIMVGYEKSAFNSLITKVVDRKNVEKYYQELLKLVPKFKDRSKITWDDVISDKNILWHNNRFIISHRYEYCRKGRRYCSAKTFQSVIKVFRYYGVSWKNFKEAFNTVFTGTHYGWDHVYTIIIQSNWYDY